ncbi:MAG TPA: hypothetical protein VE616_24475 [Candidatus Udaeobacter sp.]|nr:hypothetical protein [Candidatus Udaeobacter sp.]
METAARRDFFTHDFSHNYMRRLIAIIVFLLSIPALTPMSAGPAASPSSSMGPLRVHPGNPRYFMDGSGKPVYFTGSHTHINFKDWGYTDPPPIFDYTAYLAFLKQYNHNFIRLWTWDQTQWLRYSDSLQRDATVYLTPFPWLRVGPGTARDGKPKFDLNQFDQAYFNRLR